MTRKAVALVMWQAYTTIIAESKRLSTRVLKKPVGEWFLFLRSFRKQCKLLKYDVKIKYLGSKYSQKSASLWILITSWHNFCCQLTLYGNRCRCYKSFRRVRNWQFTVISTIFHKLPDLLRIVILKQRLDFIFHVTWQLLICINVSLLLMSRVNHFNKGHILNFSWIWTLH